MKRLVTIIIVSICILMFSVSFIYAEVFMPGMQPKESGIEFAKVEQCKMCHAQTNNGSADPFLSWQSSMMSQAARDPIFRASLAIANQDIEGVGEFCLRCHAPRGWLEDRSKPADGKALNKEDMHGVSCVVCHQFIDPLSNEAKELIENIPPGYGNAMMAVDPENIVRGPYDDSKGAMPHQTEKSEFHASGNLCGTCHDISNPLQSKDIMTEPPHTFGHIERTYSEWSLSDYARQGQSCQSCHYKQVEGGGQATRFANQHRGYFVTHGPVGGSIWAQDVTLMFWGNKELDSKAIDLGKKRALTQLREAATLSLVPAESTKAILRVTNLTGHKLPTGYPEGRRMWLNIKFLNSEGTVLKEIGKYGLKEDTLLDKPVKVPTILDPEVARVYECIPAISDKQAEKYNKTPGKSFHFVLNDIIAKDNRIPPKGFNNSQFDEHLSAPVDAAYEDGQYWDDVELELPADCKKIVVNLLYQSVSWEYLKFLVEENKTDNSGKLLYEAWNRTDKCAPVVIAEMEKSL